MHTTKKKKSRFLGRQGRKPTYSRELMELAATMAASGKVRADLKRAANWCKFISGSDGIPNGMPTSFRKRKLAGGR